MGGTRKSNNTEPISLASVVIPNNLQIPPLSEVEIMAPTSLKQADESPSSCAFLVETVNNRPPIVVANAIVATRVECSQELVVPIRLLNPSSKTVTIYKGTKIAHVSPLMESELILNVNPSQPNEVHYVSPVAQEALWQLVENSGEVLGSQQQRQLYQLLLGFADVFAFDDTDLGRTKKLHHTISTENCQPIRQAARRMPVYHKEEVRKLIEDMLKRDVIQPSKSPWASPIVIVRKKDGSARFCVDYRKLNMVTRKDAYPLPRIDDTLDTLSGSQWFSTLDLLSGYWQVELAGKDREKTAFVTQDGLFEFKVIPFGLCNAPATFQRLMDLVLAGVQWSQCLVYLDDIIVIGKSFEEHLRNLSSVLQRLREANLRLKPKKCFFCRKQVAYLGHVVSSGGVATDPEKTSKVSDWPIPTTVIEVQQFLGLAS